MDDPREGPRTAEAAVAQARELISTGIDIGGPNAFAVRAANLDFLFRLFRWVCKENPALTDDCVSRCATAAKACISAASSEQHAALNAVLDGFRAGGIGSRGAGVIVDELCTQCKKPLSGRISVFRGQKFHPPCFSCSSCHGQLAKQFALSNAGDPLCDRCSGGSGATIKQQVASVTLDLSRMDRSEVERKMQSIGVKVMSLTFAQKLVQMLNINLVKGSAAFAREGIDGIALAQLTEADLRNELRLDDHDIAKVLAFIAESHR